MNNFFRIQADIWTSGMSALFLLKVGKMLWYMAEDHALAHSAAYKARQMADGQRK